MSENEFEDFIKLWLKTNKEVFRHETMFSLTRGGLFRGLIIQVLRVSIKVSYKRDMLLFSQFTQNSVFLTEKDVPD